MKMGAGIFWGIILILIGLGIVIRVVFNIDFPVFKFLVAIFFIFLGLRMMFGSFGIVNFHVDSKNDVFFGEKIGEPLDASPDVSSHPGPGIVFVQVVKSS